MKADQPNAAQLEAHQCHKDRLKRIAAKAVKAVPVEVVAPAELEKPAEPTWEERQWAIPLPVSIYIPPTFDNIVDACAEHFGVSQIALKSHCKRHNVVKPRHIAMYLARKLSLKSLPEIGRRMGRRDHSTVLSGVRKIERKLHSDSDLAFDVAHIELSLEAA